MPLRLILSALAALPVVPAAARMPPHPPSSGTSAIYGCADGRSIEVLYSGGDAAVITIAGDTVQMLRGPAADGERYTGGGWQWWGRGARDGRLSPLASGEDVASAAGVACRVR